MKKDKLKFRAFIKDEDFIEGQMAYSADNVFVSFKGDVCIEDFQGKIIRYDMDNVVLMQYTGLKDEDGREIYEGDIIGRWEEGVPELTEKEAKRVEESLPNGTIVPNSLITPHPKIEGRWSNVIVEIPDIYFFEANNGIKDYKVIGNIYEGTNRPPVE